MNQTPAKTKTSGSRTKLKSFFCALLMLSFIPVINAKTNESEIIWDQWGVPHIYSESTEGLFYAQGWAMAKQHGNLVLKLYGEARGKAAEYRGEKLAAQDRLFRTVGVPFIGQRNYNNSDEFTHQSYQAFVNGFNDYVSKHKTQFKAENLAVYPAMPADITAHFYRILYVVFAGRREISAKWPAQRASLVASNEQVDSPSEHGAQLGSNTWAIGPNKSASGNAMLLMNPHLPWSDFFLFWESHFNSSSLNFSGITLVGIPGMEIGFNQYLGWSHTVNSIDLVDRYDLTLAEGGYLYDGKMKPFDTRTETMKIKQVDGSFITETLNIKSSVHGPIIKSNKKSALAVRFAGNDRSGSSSQYWKMMNSKNLNQFKKALGEHQMPYFNTMYADKQGDIFYISNGFYPKRKSGDYNFWQGLIPGDSSEFFWDKLYSVGDLPQITNPKLGAIQNSNDSPWTSTIPMTIRAKDYPSTMAWGESMDFRNQQSTRMLMNDDKITFDELFKYQQSTKLEMADHVLDDLIPLAKKSNSQVLNKAAKILSNWDQTTDAQSIGSVLFVEWVNLSGRNIFSDKWSATKPWSTPTVLTDESKALANLEAASNSVIKKYGKLNIPWGEVYRVKMGQYDAPANGHLGSTGSFRVLAFRKDKQDKYTAFHGDTYVTAVEFGDKVKARGLLSYGNSSEDNSPHKGDQIPLFAKKQWRDIPFTRKQVEEQKKSSQVLTF
ncbi:MAG: penicillin acylase family protein [Kangiellaceae bacterium]|nr:penicillin acylase family protein [Kangiellaceae bacterium]